MTVLEQRLQQARILAIAAIASFPLYAVAGEMAGFDKPGDFATIRLVFFVVSASTAVMGFQFRARMIPSAVDVLRRTPDDALAAQRWLTGHVLSIALAEVIGVCGFALRFLGGMLLESLPFYAVALGLLLAWFPRRPD